jgi:hypothetical protein
VREWVYSKLGLCIWEMSKVDGKQGEYALGQPKRSASSNLRQESITYPSRDK